MLKFSHSMQYTKVNIRYVFFSLIGTVIVLWQLLGNGYILTLDMIFGPHVDLVHTAGSLWNTAPTTYLLSFLTTVFGGIVAQKILLVTIFFLLFYLPLHFTRKVFIGEGITKQTYGVEYIVSLIFAVNPFVYERFLAGQWNVIFGYALLVPLLTYLLEFCKEWNNRVSLKLVAAIILMGAVSTHIFIMSLLVITVFLIVNLFARKFDISFLKKILLLGLVVLICSSYWLIPAITGPKTTASTFESEHWEAFKTTGEGKFGTLGNVLTLHGFWGEDESWASRFVLPNKGGGTFAVPLSLLLILVVAGMISGISKKETRKWTIFMIVLTCLVAVFSCGVGEGIFKSLNTWLFENISFWKGFRDTEKWSAFIAFSYALFAGLGSMKILSYFADAEKFPQFIKYRRTIFCILFAIPLFITPMMLFGFSGQLNTVQYPDSWAQVNSVLKRDKKCRALFLPWHQYYYLKFNDGILTGNVSRNYFDCDIIHAKNVELGSVMNQGDNGEEYDVIDKIVTDNNADPDEVIEILKQKGIRYIIFTDDIEYADPYLYPFLGSKYSRDTINKSYPQLIKEKGIYLYSLY